MNSNNDQLTNGEQAAIVAAGFGISALLGHFVIRPGLRRIYVVVKEALSPAADDSNAAVVDRAPIHLTEVPK